KYAQVRRRRHALRLWHFLDRRRSRRGLAGRGSGDCRLRPIVLGRRPCRRRAGAPPGQRGDVMNTLGAILRELMGLFVDDGALALAIVAIVIVAAIIATVLPSMPLAAGGLLLLGCLGVLVANV